jgi:hypothetical protein
MEHVNHLCSDVTRQAIIPVFSYKSSTGKQEIFTFVCDCTSTQFFLNPEIMHGQMSISRYLHFCENDDEVSGSITLIFLMRVITVDY